MNKIFTELKIQINLYILMGRLPYMPYALYTEYENIKMCRIL